jgi:hypothetical protein
MLRNGVDVAEAGSAQKGAARTVVRKQGNKSPVASTIHLLNEGLPVDKNGSDEKTICFLSAAN